MGLEDMFFKFNPPSAGDFNLFAPPSDAAPIKKQKQWNSFPEPKKQQLRKVHKDTDGDGVPDPWDCQPRNPFRQDRYSPQQLAEIKGLGQLEVGEFIRAGSFGAVYKVKSKDPAKQTIADNFVVKVGIDAHRAHRNFQSVFEERDEKLLDVWKRTEGHTPSLERLIRKGRKEKIRKTGNEKAGDVDMEVLREFVEYRQSGFEDMKLMIPIAPAMVEMGGGKFRTLAHLKPYLDVVGERVHNIRNKDKINKNVLEQLRAGTKQISDKGLAFEDYYQVGVTKGGTIYVFDTDYVNPRNDAKKQNAKLFRDFVHAVKREKGGGFEPITDVLYTPKDEDINLQEELNNLQLPASWFRVFADMNHAQIKKYVRIAGKDSNEHSLYLSLARKEDGGIELAAEFLSSAGVIIRKPGLTTREGLDLMQKVAKKISALRTPKTVKQYQSIIAKELDMGAVPVAAPQVPAKKSKTPKANLKEIAEQLDQKWGWPPWDVIIEDTNYVVYSARKPIITDNGTEEAALRVAVMELGGGQNAYLFAFGHIGKGGSLFTMNYPSAELAMTVALKVAKAVQLIENPMTEQELRELAENVSKANAPQLHSIRGKSGRSKGRSTPAWSLGWGNWQANHRPSDESATITKGPYTISLFRAGKLWWIYFYNNGINVAENHFSSEKEALAAAHKIAALPVFNTEPIDNARAVIQVKQILKGQAGKAEPEGQGNLFDMMQKATVKKGRHDWTYAVADDDKLELRYNTRIVTDEGDTIATTLHILIDRRDLDGKPRYSIMLMHGSLQFFWSQMLDSSKDLVEKALDIMRTISSIQKPKGLLEIGRMARGIIGEKEERKEEQARWVTNNDNKMFQERHFFMQGGENVGMVGLVPQKDGKKIKLVAARKEDVFPYAWVPNDPAMHNTHRMKGILAGAMKGGPEYAVEKVKALNEADGAAQDDDGLKSHQSRNSPEAAKNKAGWREAEPPVSDFQQFLKFHDKDGKTQAWAGVEEPVMNRFMLDFVANRRDSKEQDVFRRRGQDNLLQQGELDAALAKMVERDSLHGRLDGGIGTMNNLGIARANVPVPLGMISGKNVFQVSYTEESSAHAWRFYDIEGRKYLLVLRNRTDNQRHKGYLIVLAAVDPWKEHFRKEVSTPEAALKAVKEALKKHNNI